jgi:hypothetical protein
MPVKISSTGRQKQRHKLLITLAGLARQRSPAKSQADLSYIKRAEAISPSGVNWKTNSARHGSIYLGTQPSTISSA